MEDSNISELQPPFEQLREINAEGKEWREESIRKDEATRVYFLHVQWLMGKKPVNRDSFFLGGGLGLATPIKKTRVFISRL